MEAKLEIKTAIKGPITSLMVIIIQEIAEKESLLGGKGQIRTK